MGHNQHETIKYCPYCGTKTEEKEIYGKLRATCSACNWVNFEDPKVAAAVLVMDHGSVLLARRIYSPSKGNWTLPAGFVDAHEGPEEAAVRECLEETGLEVKIIRLLDVISGREHERGADMVIVYEAKVVGGELTAGDDADEVAFFPLNELPPLAFQATKKILRSLKKQDSQN